MSDGGEGRTNRALEANLQISSWKEWLLFSSSIISNSLWLHGLQHTRPPCPSPSPGACSHSCPLSRWYYLTILSSVTPFSSCLQSFPASASFPMSQHFTYGSHIIGAPATVFPINIQGWFLLGLTDLIFLQFKRLPRVFSNSTIWKHQFFGTQPSLCPNVISIHD